MKYKMTTPGFLRNEPPPYEVGDWVEIPLVELGLGKPLTETPTISGIVTDITAGTITISFPAR